ncbi:IS110 family transposase [Paracoccus aestuarii]|uniref:IS110 family transposase n=1 Tax=Paracoccus aestuarii TaxID=453842 RepID=A0A418ZPF5_9RHOB|nr:IS110 family transposase [Paracoccus aestuarii]RJK93284.1 IS110 family transposase [Paracoccus aestuarii]
MLAATTVVGIDVSRDWLDGFCLPGHQRFRFANSPEGHDELILMIGQMSAPVHVGFEATGGQEWVLWTALMEAGIEARQLPPAQIKAFAMSRGTRAKTDRIDAELITRFMMFRPEAGRALPGENLRVLRILTTRRAQIVEMRKRLAAQMSARRKQGIPAGIEDLDDALKAMLDAQISELEQRIERALASEQTSATKAGLLRSIPGIGPVSAAMLVAEMPELGRMTAGEAAAMAGLAPVPHDSGVMRGRRAIAGGRRALRQVLYQAALAAACHNPVLKPLAKRLTGRGKPHKVVIIAIARRLVTIANAILKTGETWRHQPG